MYDYYAKWEADGTTQQVHDLLRDKTRRAHGRSAQPTAAVVDAQSAKTSGNVPETSQGIDADKKIKGRKRHLITDTLGLVLAVLVTAASVHDTTGGKLLLDDLAVAHPSVSKAWADGGYQSSIFNHGAGLGIDVEVVQRPQTKGFKALPKRWVIERTFGWLMQHRRLSWSDTKPAREILIKKAAGAALARVTASDHADVEAILRSGLVIEAELHNSQLHISHQAIEQ